MLEEVSEVTALDIGDAPQLAPPAPPAAAASSSSTTQEEPPAAAVPPTPPADPTPPAAAAAAAPPPPPQPTMPPPSAPRAAPQPPQPPQPAQPAPVVDFQSSWQQVQGEVQDNEIVHDVVLGSGSSSSTAVARHNNHHRTAATTSSNMDLASTVEILQTVSSVADLEALLQSPSVRDMSGAHVTSVDRCVQYVRGLARENERVFCGWPVLSINEWGTQQLRTIVLTSHAVYRVAFSGKKGSIDHYSRTSLGSVKLIERGRHAFKVQLTEPDGRENPFTYFWSAYVKKGAKDNRYERVYYPIHDETVQVELAIACIVSALAVANRLLVEAVGSYCYVATTEVRDYVPNPNALDEFMDKVGPKVVAIGSNVSEKIKQLVR